MTQLGCWNKLEPFMDNMIRYILKGGCFAAGTLVMTVHGLQPIETITPGTLVLSANQHGGAVEYRQVVETFTTHPDALIEVSVKAASGPQSQALPETILSTEEHPFYVLDETFTASTAARGKTPKQGEWRGASALQAGDHVWLSSGEGGEVTNVRRLAGSANGSLTTYNFEVSEHHTYFVGKTGVWVHNGCFKAVEKALSQLVEIGYDNVPNGEKSKAIRTWLMNKDKKDRPNGYEAGFMLHHSNVDDLADLDGRDIPLADIKHLTTDRGLRYDNNTNLLGNTSDSKMGNWRSHHIYGDWINSDMGWDDLDYNDLPNVLLPGGGTANRKHFTGDFDKMTKGRDGSGYDPPFHDGKAEEGLEARITKIRKKYRDLGEGPEFRVNMGKELYDTMARDAHGKMGLHLMFKTIYNSVMDAKGLPTHKIP